VIRRAVLVAVSAALLACRGAAPQPSPDPLAAAEAAFLEARTGADRIDVRQGRGEPWSDLRPGYQAARQRALAAIAAVVPLALDAADRAAGRARGEVAAARLLADPVPVVGDGGGSAEVSCQYDPAGLLRDGGASVLTARIMACYGRQATRIPYQGRVLDRLTIFGLLGTTDDRADRERLFRALGPVAWRRSVPLQSDQLQIERQLGFYRRWRGVRRYTDQLHTERQLGE
jgi:hypothetical protein